jgi:DNA-binding response OmpR family regulator
LTKPFAFRELLARIRALLRRQATRSKDPVLRVADLELDPARRSVRRHGNAVDLTAKEFAVLELFMRNPNVVLTRTQIAEHIWDQGFVALSNVVEVYVGLLRRKLDDASEPRLLETVRGVGYRLHDTRKEVSPE